MTNNSTLQKLVYFTPADDKFKGWISPQKHVAHFCGSVSVAKQTARVLANKTLPYGNLDDTDIFEEKFASIHSWPPSPVGSVPAVVLNRYGSGKVIYSTGALDASELTSNRCLVAKLISSLPGNPIGF